MNQWIDSQGLRVVDSHTGGEPTRVIVKGGPDLGDGSLVEIRDRLQKDHDSFRRAVINEPRGNDVLVGALLLPPRDPSCQFATIFFNNVGYLGMCGHGTIGLMATLFHLGKLTAGHWRLETPVGVIETEVHDANHVSLENVPSYRYKKNVVVEVPDYGTVVGDVAWGGNWFFLVSDHKEQLELSNNKHLSAVCLKIRTAIQAQGVTGDEGAEIDHIELFSSSPESGADSKNFVLCPGAAYDRSPCGTGTSAKLACLAADGKLSPGAEWLQESITGSSMKASYRLLANGGLVPKISGAAFVYSDATLLFDSKDPFRLGIER